MALRPIAGIVARPVTTAMVTIALLVFGLVAAARLPVNLLPDISYPSITVQTTYQDAAPEEIETLVTRPVEELVGAVPGLISVESTSRESSSEVVLDFEWGTPIDRALGDVREKLDRLSLPAQAERPVVLRYDPSQDAIMRVALVPPPDGALDFSALRLEAERAVKLELEKIPGVAAAVIHGGDEDELRVELDPRRLAALDVSPDQVVLAIDGDNVNRPGGAVDFRDRRHLIRTIHEAVTPEDIGAVVVRNEGGRTLRVRDLGEVRQTPIEREELALVEGVEAVELAIFREGDANTVTVATAVREKIARLRLASGARLEVLEDRAVFIESAVDEVLSNVLVGGVLAVIVLLIFLRDLWSTVVVAVAIPISVLVSFIPLNVADVSLNLMSLGGLALGVGMLVDNSIVTLEAVARVRERAPDRPRRAAAIEGTQEVAAAVVASTLTTVAVFVPLVFVTGVAGQLIRDLALAVTFSILSSMLVSLTLVPVLLASVGELAPPTEASLTGARPLARARLIVPTLALLGLPAAGWWLEGGARAAAMAALAMLALPMLSALASLATRPWRRFRARRAAAPSPGRAVEHGGAHTRAIAWVIGRAPWVIALALILTGGAVVAAGDLARTLVPALDQDRFFLQLTLPQGTSLERSAAVARRAMRRVSRDEAVDLTYGRVGSLTRAGSAAGAQRGTHLAQVDVRVNVEDPEAVAAIEDALLAEISALVAAEGGTVRLERPSLISFAAPLELRLFADDLEVAAAQARALLPRLRAVEDLRDVTPDDLSGRPEVRVDFDRVKLGAVGLSIDEAASVTQAFVQGQVATTKLRTPEAQLDIRVQLPRVNRTDEEDVRAIQVGTVGGVPVRLSSVAEVRAGQGPAEIRRIEGQRGIRIHARMSGADLAAARDAVTAAARDGLGDDVTFEVAGQARDLDGSLQSLAFAALLAIFLVYVVMASTFESLHHPLLIIFTVPLALLGVVAALLLTGLSISAMVGMGVIILGGIVVNNAIVMVSAINLRRGRGLDTRAAIIEGAGTRTRPILMTTITTVLGLAPMALGLGDGAALRQPLAVSVIGGLTSATALTLLVLPAVYSLLPGRARETWDDGRGGADTPAPAPANDAQAAGGPEEG